MIWLLWKTVWSFLKKLKIELLSDLAIPLLGIHPKEVKLGSGRVICTPMFIGALFTIAKIWEQPICPSTDEWVKNMFYIHTMEYYSDFQTKELIIFMTWIKLEYIMLSEISQSQKDKYHRIPLYELSYL